MSGHLKWSVQNRTPDSNHDDGVIWFSVKNSVLNLVRVDLVYMLKICVELLALRLSASLVVHI